MGDHSEEQQLLKDILMNSENQCQVTGASFFSLVTVERSKREIPIIVITGMHEDDLIK